MASISFRKFIRWVPEEASEPTSTLVLTSPEKRFVDIRVLLPDGKDSLANNEGNEQYLLANKEIRSCPSPMRD